MTNNCQAPGCIRRAKGYARYCNSHRARNRRHGDPMQTTVTTARLRPYALAIQRYVERAGGDALWADLMQLWDAAVSRARGVLADYRAGRPSFTYEVRAAADLVAVAGEVSGRRCVETVAAMVLMQEQEPHTFRSDKAFWVQVSRRVRGLATCHAVKYAGSDGRTRRVYRDANPLAAVTLGRRLCESVGLVGLGAYRAGKADERRILDARSAVHAAMRAPTRPPACAD